VVEDSRPLAPVGRSASLSPRELEVLERASEGYTNGEIAMQLNVTVHAVKWHLASIYRKLGVGNRTEAAITYVRELSGPGTSVAQGQG
jgi:DNA-binding CsgD family transcriptional regulator